MSELSQITPDQLQALLNFASHRLGMTPEQLAKTVQQGGLSSIAGTMNADSTRRINELVGDPQKAEQFMNSPQVQELLARLLGGSDKRG